MRWIYISPHLDDAILSAGGLIYDQVHAGHEVEIWTMVCGYPSDQEASPFARELHEKWGFHSIEETVRSRREENRLAAKIVGARDVYFDFIDCIYRRGRDGNWLYTTNTFVPPHPDDEDIPARMTQSLLEKLKPDDVIVCPLAIGGHTDHVIVRRAVEGLSRPLFYYADIPYLLDNSSALKPIKAGMKAKYIWISGKGLSAWQDGASAYSSQIALEFESQKKMRSAIARYGRWSFRLWALP